jgi:hypothetical protein
VEVDAYLKPVNQAELTDQSEKGGTMKKRWFVLGLILAIFAISIGCSRESKPVRSSDSQSQTTPATTTKKTNELGASSTAASKTGVSAAEIIARPEIPRVTCRELKKLMDMKAKIAIVDARSMGAWESEHIPGSFCIPPAESSVDPDTRRDQIMAFAPNTLIVIYCD